MLACRSLLFPALARGLVGGGRIGKQRGGGSASAAAVSRTDPNDTRDADWQQDSTGTIGSTKLSKRKSKVADYEERLHEANEEIDRLRATATATATSNTRITSTVCPCCFGAVHCKKKTDVDPSLQAYFRSYSTTRIRYLDFSNFSSNDLHPSKSSPDDHRSVVELIKDQHQHAKQLFKAYTKAESQTHKKKLVGQLIKAINQQTVQEERWMKAHHKETADQVEQHLRAYHHLTGQLSELSDLLESSSLDSGSSSSAPSEVESAEFDRLLSRVWHDASRQFDEEESTILATLEKVATAHELVDLGKRFIEMKPIQTQHKSSPVPSSDSSTAIVDHMRDRSRFEEPTPVAAL